jgi:rhodanese-related sulfurtransferase
MSWTEISITDLVAVDSPYVVDVREVDEYTGGHVPAAINVPLSTLVDSYSVISAEPVIYVVCQLGGRSARACEFLSNLSEYDGVKFVNVVGGTAAWILEGNEVVSGDQPS